MESLLSRALTERPYAPIFITIFFAILVSIAGAISHTLPQAQVFTPEGEGVSAQAHAGLLNALILVIPAAGGSFIILYLIRKGRLNLLLSLYKFLFFLLSSMVFYFIGDIPLYLIQSRTIPYFPGYFLSYRAVLYSLNWDAPFAVGVTVSAIVASQLFSPYSDRRRKNTSLMVLSGILGGFMAVTLPTWTVLIVLLLLSAYDIYAVFYGPIKEITSMSVRGGGGTPGYLLLPCLSGKGVGAGDGRPGFLLPSHLPRRILRLYQPRDGGALLGSLPLPCPFKPPCRVLHHREAS